MSLDPPAIWLDVLLPGVPLGVTMPDDAVVALVVAVTGAVEIGTAWLGAGAVETGTALSGAGAVEIGVA